jgi:hypothetical protein
MSNNQMRSIALIGIARVGRVEILVINVLDAIW